VKFARFVVELKPEPWAEVTRHVESDEGPDTDELLTWKEGQIDVRPSTVASIIGEELSAAHVPVEGESSLFASESKADLLLGVSIKGLAGRFCLSCGRLGLDHRWRGAVVMDARWEIYSSLERKVIATIPTHGGFTAPKEGLEGAPERLIYEALRDNLRVLIASDDFRRAVTTAPDVSARPSTTTAALIVLHRLPSEVPLAQTTNSVATVFAADGSGSGFLVSADGYLITNHHVVGASKYVKLKWPDGSETLGEVLRSDRRRDVALIKSDVHGRTPLDLRLGAPQQGEAVFAIGSPLGDRFQNTMTKGIVSAIRTESGQTFIQSDVMVNHGSSGGPLLDEKGRVIGLTVSGQFPNGDPIGLNFFIPIGDALKALALTPAAG
jgi:S1-C subfamily serine protease